MIPQDREDSVLTKQALPMYLFLQSGRHCLKLLGPNHRSSALPRVQAKADTSKSRGKGSLDIVGVAKC